MTIIFPFNSISYIKDEETTPFAKGETKEGSNPARSTTPTHNRFVHSMSISRSFSSTHPSVTIPQSTHDSEGKLTSGSIYTSFQAGGSSLSFVRRFLSRYKRQIILNITTFFLVGAVYSFEIYSPNFVGK